MRKTVKLHLNLLLAGLFILLGLFAPSNVQASSYYSTVIYDDADFFTDEQEQQLYEEMEKVTEFGNAAIVTTTDNPYFSTKAYAELYYDTVFGKDASGVIFTIDMDRHEIYLYSEGDLSYKLTSAKSSSITDNTYRYATEDHGRDFYTCSLKTFQQVNTVIRGGHISQPMKYISNALLAIVLAMLINYFVVMAFSKSKKPTMEKLLSSSYTNVEIANKNSRFINKSKRYSPKSSSSSGGHGGGSHHSSGGGHHI